MSNPAEHSHDPERPDPLAKLYRMSKTAGLASSEYKAVNAPSVTAMILGIVSAAANFEPVLLVIPLLAIVLGAVAIHQIRGSNGTQTGLPMAALGILLALGFGGWAATGQAREAAQTRADREQLMGMIRQLGQRLSAGEIDGVYNEMFSPSFRQRVGRDDFQTLWNNLQRQLGKVKSADSNGLFNFESDRDTGLRVAVGRVIFEYERSTPAERPEIVFFFRDGQWRIESIPSFFPPSRTGPTG
jgi:hypothetical protein